METRTQSRIGSRSSHETRRRPRRFALRRSALAGTIALGMLAAAAPWSSGVALAAAPTFYVDCSGGNDTAAGTSTGQAWKTIGRANSATLAPGASLLLKRGCTFGATLRARWAGTAAAPITIGSYGTGALPIIQNQMNQVMITGTHLIIQDLQARADPVTHDTQCQNARAGRRSGFRFASGSSFDLLQRSVASELFIGIELDNGSHNNRVLNNVARNNNMKSDIFTADSGAVGITLMGDDNEVAHNTVSGSDVCSRFYGRDGSAIEVYGGRRNLVHHNRAINNNQFTELGNSRSSDNTFAYNVVTSTLSQGHFMTTRGAKDKKYGPVLRTKLYNNSVYLTGATSFAIQCNKGCGPTVLSMHNNVVWAADRIGVSDAKFDEGNNIYWTPSGTLVWFPMSSTSRKIDPKYVAPGSGNLSLQAASPAINKATTAAVTLGLTTDFAGASVPFGGAVDIGAYERH